MRARLTVHRGNASPRSCELQSGDVAKLGRNRDNTIVLQDRFASRWHAQVFARGDCWYIRDENTVNGTRLDGEPILREAQLRNGQEIAIGEVHLRFDALDVAPTERLPPLPAPEAPAEAPAEPDPCPTILEVDELTGLFRFMNESLVQETPQQVVRLALEALRRHARADQVGYLGLCTESGELEVVLPEQAPVDKALSRHLTRKVSQEGRTVWLAGAARHEASDSLVSFRDALCVPVRGSSPAAEPGLLGALHAYRAERPFSEREARFCQVLAGSLANALQVVRDRRALEADNSRLRDDAGNPSEEMVGDSPAMRRLREQVRRLADCPCNVLILGESGVGKELVALALHRHSRRAREPLVPVNCAAICETLPESMLFGHRKGAFTGATGNHPGLFQMADMGTLFLDEVGDLPGGLQAKLLRALESNRILPLGAREEVPVDVRVLAATNHDLDRDVKEGAFREDLLYRLQVATIQVPPLRERREDVPALAQHFLKRINARFHRRVALSEAAVERLVGYNWPGNVRQLHSVLQSAVALAGSHDLLRPDAFPLGQERSGEEEGLDLEKNVAAVEERTIRRALEQANGNQTQASQLLGIHRETLQLKMRKYGLGPRKG
jgi:Nif-specific regulatory protein